MAVLGLSAVPDFSVNRSGDAACRAKNDASNRAFISFVCFCFPIGTRGCPRALDCFYCPPRGTHCLDRPPLYCPPLCCRRLPARRAPYALPPSLPSPAGTRGFPYALYCFLAGRPRFLGSGFLEDVLGSVVVLRFFAGCGVWKRFSSLGNRRSSSSSMASLRFLARPGLRKRSSSLWKSRPPGFARSVSPPATPVPKRVACGTTRFPGVVRWRTAGPGCYRSLSHTNAVFGNIWTPTYRRRAAWSRCGSRARQER